jgi:glycosyltransferase involved in cell wall biosynthesis
VSRPELSAIVLCYRAGRSILHLVDALDRQLREAGLLYELVLVANYWPDGDDTTPQVVTEYAGRNDRAVVVSKPKAGAMGWDMRSGLEAATGEILIVIDGDAQNPTEDVLRMYRLMGETKADVMKGLRIARYDGLYRRGVSLVYNFLFRALFGTTGLWDINGKPKGMTREAYERMRLKSDDWFADAEIVLEAKRLDLRIGEMPVIFRRNDDRPSFVRPGAILQFLGHMLARRVSRAA